MNVELVSKTVPNKEYFEKVFDQYIKNDNIGINWKESQKVLQNLDSEQLMIYIARVSSDRDNKLEDYEGLLNYLIDNAHWSPFQMADMTVEIETSRAMARQMIRHRSFKFQEFSQRYSSDIEFENFELRAQPKNNRQSSLERLATILHNAYSKNDSGFKYTYPQSGEMNKAGESFRALARTSKVLDQLEESYQKLIDVGVASETARMILPECTRTTLYMKGSIRSWLHYIQLRMEENTQKEHRQVAEEIRKIFVEEFPVTAKATKLDNNE